MGFLSDLGHGITGAIGGFFGGGPAGAVLGGIGGLLGARDGSRGTTTQPGTPGWITDQARLGFRNLNTALARPPTEAIAPFNRDQLAAFQQVRDAQGFGDHQLSAVGNDIRRIAQGVTPEMIRQFYNPFEKDVIAGYQADTQHALGMNDIAAGNEAAAAGAFNSDPRGQVYSAILDSNTLRDFGSQVANLRYGGYQNAGQMALQNQGFRLAGNEALANLINSRRDNRYQDAGALGAVGDARYGRTQSLLDYRRNAALDQINAAGSMLGGGGVQSAVRTGGGFGGALGGFLGGAQTGQRVADIIGDIWGSWGADNEALRASMQNSGYDRVG